MKTKFVYKLCKTIALIGIWISSGIGLEIVGPCIPDLKVRLGLNYEEISRAFIGPSISIVIGAVIGGVLHQRFQRLSPLFFAFGNIVGAVGITLIPWMTSLWTLGLMLFLSLWAIGTSNPGGNALILKLWGKKNSGPPLFSLHFGFGLGGLLAPQIARPFISDVIQDADDSLYNKDQNISVINYENYSICSNDSMCISRNATNNPLIIYPFIISGGVFVATALPFFLFQAIDCVSPATDEEYIEEDEDDEEKAKLCSVASCASEHTCFGIIMLLLLFLYYMQVVGGEHVYGKWIYSFALETDTGFTKDQATLLVSLFWFCHMSGRGIGMILSKFIHITYIIIGDIAGLMVSSIALSIWGHKVPMVLWVFTAAMGLLVSPMFPAGLLWANLHMRINPITLTICMMGGSAGHLVYVYMGGFFLEYFGTERVMLTEVIYAVTIAVIFILMHITTRLHYRMMDNSLAVAKEIVYVSSEELEMIQDEGRSDSREMVYVPKSFRA